mmetsp:Transcript_1573/g.5929  ORF Transcript_1573/g.5929 Transcript_1573/m.5929 type:complete len:226 (+) Transcript_1573:1583-2260(+)
MMKTYVSKCYRGGVPTKVFLPGTLASLLLMYKILAGRNIGDFMELWVAILLVDSHKTSSGGLQMQIGKHQRTWHDVFLLVSRVHLQLVSESWFIQTLLSGIHCCTSNFGIRILQTLHHWQCEFYQKLCKHLSLFVTTRSLAIPHKKCVLCGNSEVKIESVQHELLHPEDLIPVVGFITDIHKISDFRGPNFFILGSNQHGRYTHQLQIFAGHLLLFQEPVNQIDC